MKGDELKRRTKEFAHRCVKLAMSLPETPIGKHIRGQLIRCSTSVAANYRASCLAQSKAGFISKLSIVIEEADESYFWLEFIVDESMMQKGIVDPLLKEAFELTAIFITSRKTASQDKGLLPNDTIYGWMLNLRLTKDELRKPIDLGLSIDGAKRPPQFFILQLTFDILARRAAPCRT